MNYIVYVFIFQIKLNIQEYLRHFFTLKVAINDTASTETNMVIINRWQGNCTLCKKLQRLTIPKQYNIFKII